MTREAVDTNTCERESRRVQREGGLIIVPFCRICGAGVMTPDGLCLSCAEIREWSRVNRAFCRLLHRPRRRCAGSEPDHILD